MKIKLIWLLSTILVACSAADDFVFKEVSVDAFKSDEETFVQERGSLVTFNEVSNIIKEKCTSKSRSEDASISTIRDDGGNVTIYIVNYGSNEGWQIISGSKNVQPILAYSDKGHFDVKDLTLAPLGLSYWIENARMIVEKSFSLSADSSREARLQWKKYEDRRMSSRSNARDYNPEDILKYISKDEYDRLMQIVNDSINSWNEKGWVVQICDNQFMDENPDILEYALGTIYGPYTDAVCQLTFKVEKTWTDTHSSKLVNTVWQQVYPYNQSFPSVGNLSHAYVGCVPLAVGQLMRYFQFPNRFDWSSMPYDYATATTSNFLLDVARMVKAEFGERGTSSNIKNAKEAMTKYGYNTSKIYDFKNGDRIPSVGYFKADLKIKDEYKSSFEDGGHAWISGGSSSITEFEEILYYTFWERLKMNPFNVKGVQEISHNRFTYMIWGWSTNYNGYFSDYALTCPVASKMTDIQYFSVTIPQ